MIKNMLDDLKIAAMDVVADVKEVAHDAMTKLPDEVPIQFNNEAEKQNIPQQELSYMTPNTWGAAPAQMTANRIDMIAEKIDFVSEMIGNGLVAFDAVEQELISLSRGQTPPTPAQLQGIAGRVDANQKQILMGLQKLRQLAVEIDKATDHLQGNKGASQGWGTRGIGNQVNTNWY